MINCTPGVYQASHYDSYVNSGRIGVDKSSNYNDNMREHSYIGQSNQWNVKIMNNGHQSFRKVGIK